MLPDELTYKLNKSAALFEARRDADCTALCEEVIESGRSQKPIPFAKISKALARLGSIEQRAGRMAEALEQFERAQAESHSPVVEKKIKALKKTIAEAEELAYRDPTKAAEAKELGNTEFKACNFLAAIDHYSEAVKRDPDNAIYWTNRATARCKVLDFGGAMRDVKAAIKLNPEYAKAYGRKARIEMLSKQYHHALDTVSEGLHRDSTNAELQEVMAELQVKINQAMFAAPDPVRQERAMQDPEIQAIMRDPMVQQALRDLGTDPTAMSKISADPVMNRKINRLILAGVVSFGSPAGADGAAAV
jgi:stress-induced-phosphoprotein 1